MTIHTYRDVTIEHVPSDGFMFELGGLDWAARSLDEAHVLIDEVSLQIFEHRGIAVKPADIEEEALEFVEFVHDGQWYQIGAQTPELRRAAAIKLIDGLLGH